MNRNDQLQLVLVAAAVGVEVAMHWWNPVEEVGRGFIVIALVMTVLFQTLRTCVIANVLVVVAWAFAWRTTGTSFTHAAILSHAAMAPLFSCALFASHHRALRRLSEFYRKERQHDLETQDAMRLVIKEAACRAESEAELRRANQEFDEFMQRVPAVCFRRTADKMLFVSPAYEKIFGRSVESLYADPSSFLEAIHPDDRQRVNEEYQAFLDGGSFEAEYRVVRPDGTVRWVYDTTQKIVKDDGSCSYVVGIAQDVTSCKEAQRTQQREREILENVLRAISDGVFIRDLDGRITLTNPTFCRTFGVEHRHLFEDPFRGTTGIASQVIDDPRDRGIISHGEQLRQEFQLPAPEGDELYLKVIKTPLLDSDGRITGIVGVTRNVTQRRRAAERFKQQEALLLHASRLSSLGELIAGIAHEVNQPLYSILNYAKAVENTFNDSADPDLELIRQWNRNIHQEAIRGGKITQRLRSFVKRIDTQRTSMDINQVVNESVGFIASVGFVAADVQPADVLIQRKYSEGLPEVCVDRVQIQQVLVNLIKNAIEAVTGPETESARVVVSTRLTPAGVEVSVADNGPGIPPEQAAAIFEPFHTTKEEGVGLGLAISNTIIEAHDGLLTYDTNKWGGATFCFTLARNDCQEKST